MKSIFNLYSPVLYAHKYAQGKMEKTYFSIDIEADGQNPAVGSMIELGAVVVGDPSKTFTSRIRPQHDKFDEKSLQISGINRDELMKTAPTPEEVMQNFNKWILSTSSGRSPVFVSDNSFDWSFVDFYFHKYLGNNPFGHSPRNLHDLHKGFYRSLSSSIKEKRGDLTHSALEDALANAKYMQALIDQGLSH